MGRLRKSTVDMIVRLRRQGYTQTETAEKAKVHLKTVQKYDPLRKSSKVVSSKSAKRATIESLESDLKTLGDWADAIRTTLLVKLGHRVTCPKCMEGELDADDGTNIFVCSRCRYEMLLFSNVWEKQ